MCEARRWAFSERCGGHTRTSSICLDVTTFDPNKVQICWMTFQANITKPENVAVQTTESLTRLQVTRAAHSNDFRRREKKGRREGPRPLVSFSLQQFHLLLSTAPNIRGLGRAKGPGTRAWGRMSRLTLNPAAKPARLGGTLRPRSENKGRGLTLARQPPVPGWTPSLLRLFKGAL